MEDIRDLVDVVRRCYPGTELFCWHTAPLVATDSRNPHWFDKRPNVVAALNAAGRFVAKEKGLCLLDWDLMFQVRSHPPSSAPGLVSVHAHLAVESDGITSAYGTSC